MDLPARNAATDGSLPPDGDYLIEIVDAKHWVAEATGNESLFVKGRILEGDWAGCEEPVTWVSPKFQNGRALRRAVDVLLPGTPEDAGNLTKDMIDRMVGSRAVVTIKQEPYQGDMKVKIDSASFRRPDESAGSDVPAPDVPTAEPAAAVTNGQVSEDKIPF